MPGLHENVLRRTPEGRWGKPDDFRGIAVFLASAASDFITGTAIAVDGGVIRSRAERRRPESVTEWGAMTAPDSTPLTKYGLRIRTRSGTPVDNLTVQARDQAEAERKISQMYPSCEILECRQIQSAIGDDALNLDSIISLIAKQPDGKSED